MKKKFLILGLTGSIGMGKSTIAKMFESLGLARFDADAFVHELLKPGSGVESKIKKLFPGAALKDKLDRRKLGEIVFQNPQELKKLESILHPLVWKERRARILTAKKENKPGIVLEIPLLFETGADKQCDRTITVSATKMIQKERVLGRKGMTRAKFRAILRQQLDDGEKRRRADFIVKNNGTRACAKAQVRAIWEKLSKEFFNA